MVQELGYCFSGVWVLLPVPRGDRVIMVQELGHNYQLYSAMNRKRYNGSEAPILLAVPKCGKI